MKYMFASDLHGSAYHTRDLLDAFDRSGAEKLILLGDLLYHGPRNMLPEEYNTQTVFDMLNAYADRIIAVRGNCDAEVDQVVLTFPMMADYAWLRLNDINFFATHGHIYNETAGGVCMPPVLGDGDVLIHGHTHVPAAEIMHWQGRKIYLLNPGSASLPKGGSPASYALLEENRFSVLDFEGRTVRSITIG